MKDLLAVVSLLLGGVAAQYPPSGWKPNGPAFELPEKVSQNQNQQQYLPPVDPRIPSTQYGVPDVDVSVQGLPDVEQRPVFQVSPVDGQQYAGPEFNRDIKNLDESYRQRQYQLQQDQYREFERQRQLEAQARSRAQSTLSVPRQSATDAPSTEATTKDFSTTESTTESDLNEGEVENKEKNNNKVTVEVSRQNIQEYPGELFLSALAQLQLQPQFVPFGQIRAPLYFQPIQQEPSQKQVAGFDGATHFAALPSVLAQQQYYQGVQAQGFVNPAFQQQSVISGQDANGFVAQNPQPFIPSQYQPAIQVAQNPQFTNQYQPAQPQNPKSEPVQPQNDQNQDDEEDDQNNDQEQPRFLYQQSYQPQEVIYQAPVQQGVYQAPAQQGVYQTPAPQEVYQAPQQAVQYQPQQGFQQQAFQPQGVIYQSSSPQQAPVNQYQPQEQQMFYQAPQAQYQPQQTFLPQAQLVNYQPLVQQYQNGLAQQQFPQQVSQPDALQSGLDVNQQGNGIEPNDQETDDQDQETNQDDGATSVAVATAFGTRTQPRVFTKYGAPAQPTTQSSVDEQVTENSGAVANAFAGRRKSAKLRSRRVRPVFTLDRSGHLVLAPEQN